MPSCHLALCGQVQLRFDQQQFPPSNVFINDVARDMTWDEEHCIYITAYLLSVF